MRNLFIEQSLKYLITVLITFSVKIQSQNLQSISPFTPEMSNLVKRVDIPLNYSSGALNYSLNLYTLKLRNLELPITLNYASTGFKPDVNSSNIGLGWDIEVGGKISHTIKGLDDLQYPNESAYFPEGEFPVDRPLKMNYNEYVDPEAASAHPEYFFLTSDPKSRFWPGITFRPHWGINADTQPDIFYYSFPGKSGKFFLDKTKTIGIQMPMGKEQISYEVGKFKIVDTSGNIYEYATKDLILMDSFTILISGAHPIGNTSTNYSNFYLSKIYSQNDVVEFVYDNVEYAYDNPTSYTKGVIQNGGTPITGYTPTYEIQKASVVTKHTLPILKAIKVNDKQRISFNYNAPPRKDVKNIYEKKISPLSEIVVKEDNNFYNIKLEQTYFLSALTNLPSYSTSWLKLNTVTINDTKYSFEYYEDGVVPTKDTESKDFWGYYSLNAGSRYSKKDFKNYFYVQNRRPDKEATKLTTLKKIIYPTKGEDSFSYESNTYNEANYKEYNIYQQQAAVIYNNEFLNNQQIFEEYKQFTIGTAINNEKVTLTYNIPFISGGATTTHFINYSLKNETANSYESFPALSGYGTIEMYLAPGTYMLSMKAAGLDSDAFIKFDWEEITLTSQGQKNLEVGGLRLSEITTKDHTGNALLKKQITYNDNNLISTGILYDYPIFFEVENVGETIFDESFAKILSFSAFYKKYNSNSLSDITGFNGNSVYYSKVEEKIVASNNLDKGRVVYYFSIFNDSPLYYNKYYLTYNDNSWKRGLLTKQEFYRKNEFLPFKTIDNRYKILETPQTNLGESGIGYTAPSQPNELHRMSYEFFIESPHYSFQYKRYLIRGVANFDFIGKKLVSAWVYKDQETTTENINNKILKTTTDYVYSNPVNAQLSKTIMTFPNKSLQETTYQYAHEKNKTKLIEANMVGITLETTVVKKQNSSDPGKTISKTYTDYPDTLPDTQTGNLLLPKSVSTLDMVTGGMSTEVTYNQYDNKGNILQYTIKTGVPTAIIWDKSQTQPIAKVEGATYAQASAVAGDIVTASDQSQVGYSETNLLAKLDAFRNDATLKGFQITTYTYKPLIGVTNITPPSGIREIYIYDTANRLQEVRDVNGNLLKSYEYHYKP